MFLIDQYSCYDVVKYCCKRALKLPASYARLGSSAIGVSLRDISESHRFFSIARNRAISSCLQFKASISLTFDEAVNHVFKRVALGAENSIAVLCLFSPHNIVYGHNIFMSSSPFHDIIHGDDTDNTHLLL